MYQIVHGKMVVKRGNAFYVVHKKLDIAERIHCRQGGGDAGWNRQMVKPAIKVRNTRTITQSHSV